MGLKLLKGQVTVSHIETIQKLTDEVRLVCRARRAEAHIQQMLWKVSYSDIVFVNAVSIASFIASSSNTRNLSRNHYEIQLR